MKKQILLCCLTAVGTTVQPGLRTDSFDYTNVSTGETRTIQRTYGQFQNDTVRIYDHNTGETQTITRFNDGSIGVESTR
jgi:hypothetical protein